MAAAVGLRLGGLPRSAWADAALWAEDLIDRPVELAARVGAAPAGGESVRRGELGAVFESKVLAASREFSHVGLHWSAGSGANPVFEIRTSRDGDDWTEWRRVAVERVAGEAPAGDAFANLIGVGPARLVQYRIVGGAAGDPAAELRHVTATVIDAPVVPIDLVQPRVRVIDPMTGLSLGVTPREWWGADEALRFTRDGGKVWNEMFVPAKKVVIHHTAGRNDYATRDQAAAEVRAIYYYHAVTQAWGDIGYNLLIDKFGNVYEGRHGRGEGRGREIAGPGVVAGHVLGHNYGSVGIALIGDATAPDWPMPAAAGPMWASLVGAATFESGRHFIRPIDVGPDGADRPAASDFLQSRDRWTDAMHNLSGHRETFPTECPGDPVMALLPDRRRAIAAGLAGNPAPAIGVDGAGREWAWTGRTELPFRWDAGPAPAGWTLAGFEYSLEGWHLPPGSEDLDYYSGYDTAPEPAPVWDWFGPEVWSGSFPIELPGHYTLHVRAVYAVEGKSGKAAGPPVRAVYAGNHTYLVRRADPPAGAEG